MSEQDASPWSSLNTQNCLNYIHFCMQYTSMGTYKSCGWVRGIFYSLSKCGLQFFKTQVSLHLIKPSPLYHLHLRGDGHHRVPFPHINSSLFLGYSFLFSMMNELKVVHAPTPTCFSSEVIWQPVFTTLLDFTVSFLQFEFLKSFLVTESDNLSACLWALTTGQAQCQLSFRAHGSEWGISPSSKKHKLHWKGKSESKCNIVLYEEDDLGSPPINVLFYWL